MITGAQLQAKTLEIAKGYVGETRANAHDQIAKFLDLFGLPFADPNGKPYAFCAAGLAWSACKAYEVLSGGSDFEMSHMRQNRDAISKQFVVLSAAVHNIRDNAISRGVWQKNAQGIIPPVGAWVVYDWQGDGQTDHIGLVRSYQKGWQKPLLTVEFNTSSGTPGDQSNGGGIWLRERDTADVMGYVILR